MIKRSFAWSIFSHTFSKLMIELVASYVVVIFMIHRYLSVANHIAVFVIAMI